MKKILICVVLGLILFCGEGKTSGDQGGQEGGEVKEESKKVSEEELKKIIEDPNREIETDEEFDSILDDLISGFQDLAEATNVIDENENKQVHKTGKANSGKTEKTDKEENTDL